MPDAPRPARPDRARRRVQTRATATASNGRASLDPSEARELMRRFARGSGHADRAGRRFGLGLALVNEVVEAHRGHLEVTGSPGHGARFVVDLPAVPAGDTPAPAPAMPHRD
ncbi:ATP-binding protein [Dactylosporangium sp. NPDC050688]|uniref:ATP-binding protein n=1 Tax=Dactylosporangium sp. NPDC050688 TaxID=3157217 RepID=UPI0033F272C8